MNEKETRDDGVLGPCGCVDYHMSDCPLRTSHYDSLSELRYEGDYE